MRLITIAKGVDAHLLGNQAFIYAGDTTEMLMIDGIENASNALDLIIEELEFMGRASSFSSGIQLSM